MQNECPGEMEAMMTRLKALWRLLMPKIPKDPSEREEAMIRQSISLRARGNVLLQRSL